MTHQDRWLRGLMVAAIGLLGLGQALGAMITEAPALPMEEAPEEAVILTGTVIRQEETVYVPFSAPWQVAAEGEKVRPGQVICYLEEPSEASEAALHYALPEVPLRDAMIHETVAAMDLGAGDPAKLMELVTGQASGEAAVVTETLEAPVGGWFVVDPGEDLAVGRIVTSEIWQFWAETEEAWATGDELPALLLGGAFFPVSLKVEGREGNRVLFSCREGIEYVAAPGQISVKILPE